MAKVSIIPVLTPEQSEALAAYANVYQFPGEGGKVQRARELINDIIAKRDELARVLGLREINIDLVIFGAFNSCDLGEAGCTLSQAVEMKKNDECLQKKLSKMYSFGNVTEITDYDRRLNITVHHNKK